MKNNFLKNLFYSYGSVVITSFIGFISLPLSLNYFGKSLFGLFSITNDTLAYLGLLNFGIPWAAATIFAKLHTYESQRKLLLRAIGLLLCLSFLIMAALLVFALFFPGWIHFLSGINSSIEEIARLFISISIVFYIIKLPFSLFGQLLIFINRVYISKIVDILASIFTIISLVIVIKFKFSIIQYAYINGVISLIPLILSIFIFIRIWRDQSDRSHLEVQETKDITFTNIISGSFFFFLNGIGGLIIWNTDSLIIGHYLGLAEIAEYAVMFKFFTILFMLVTQIMNITNPLYPKFFKMNSYDILTNLFNIQIKIFPLVGGFIFIMLFGFFKDFVYLWTHNSSIYIGTLSCFLMGLYCYFLCSSNIPYSAIVSLGQAKLIYRLTILEAVINLIFSIFLVQKIGVAGVILGTLISHILTMFILVPKALKKLFPIFEFDFLYIFKHLLFVVAPCAGLLFWLNSYTLNGYKIICFVFICVYYFGTSYVLFGKKNLFMAVELIKRLK